MTKISYDPPVTKQAYVFLCLFDGLRIPSIRRLTRKPKTICFQPLINFDPSLFSPSTKNAIGEKYEALMKCPCDCTIDPTTHEVTQRITQESGRLSNERIIIHYYGQGSLPPNKGSLFFFDSKRTSYRGLKIETIIGTNTAPVCLVVDVDSAGYLLPELQKVVNNEQRDIIAFMACSEGEQLPSAPSLPLDILSCSILAPTDSALWLHLHRSVFSANFKKFGDSARQTLTKFLNAIIDAVAVSKLQTTLYQRLFTEDPAVAAISRGFILASRILSFDNVHTCSVPEIPRTDNSELWGYWDLALDSVLAQGESVLPYLEDVFRQLVISFKHFPSASSIPILCHFLEFPCYNEEVSNILYAYIDKSVADISFPMNKLILKTVSGLPTRTSLHYLILAKLMMIYPPEQAAVKTFGEMFAKLDRANIQAGLLAACCCLSASSTPDQSQFLQLCVDNAFAGAPYSGVMFGLIVQKSSTFMMNSMYLDAFLPLLSSQNSSDRAAGVFALGYTRDMRAIPPLIEALNDSSPIVVSEALMGLSMALRFDLERNTLEDSVLMNLRQRLCYVSHSIHPLIQSIYEGLSANFDTFFEKIATKWKPHDGCYTIRPGTKQQSSCFKPLPTSRLPVLLHNAVRASELANRFQGRIFDDDNTYNM